MRVSIKADSAQQGGTRFYKIPKSDLIDYAWKSDGNVWIDSLLKDHFDDNILEDVMFLGSRVIDGSLYYCVSDLLPIEVDGEYVDPENALDDYSLKDLSGYIVDPAPRSVIEKVDFDDLSFSGVDLEAMAIAILEDGESLYKLFEDADALSLVSE